MKSITVNECVMELFTHKIIYGCIFLVVLLSAWAYSVFLIPYYYMGSFSVTLPPKVDINVANTVTQIMNGQVMPHEPLDNVDAYGKIPVSYKAILSASGDVIQISFSSTNRQKLIAFQKAYEQENIPRLRQYIMTASGTDSGDLIDVIDYKYPRSDGKTYNLFAIILLSGIIVGICDILVVLRKENRR